MAESNHTSEPSSTKVKYPLYRQLTILETICENAVKIRGVGINHVPVNLEPCILLRGKWLKQAGFNIGGKVTITANTRGELVITPNPVSPSLVTK